MSNEYRQLVEMVKIIKTGDILEVKGRPDWLINVERDALYLHHKDNKQRGSAMYLSLENLVNTHVRIARRPVGWQEAFEAYENGYSIECEYNGEMVWFNRDIVTIEESSMLADMQLVGLLTTEWFIKSNPKK